VAEAPIDLHVMFVVGSFGIGGAERQAIDLAGALHREGVRVSIVALSDGPLRNAVDHGVMVHVLGKPFGVAPASIPRLRTLLRETRPDVIYAFLEVQWLLSVAARGTASSVPAIAFALRTGSYDAPTAGMRPRIVHALLSRASRRADMLVANSTSGISSFRRVCGTSSPGCVIANGVDTDSLAPDARRGRALRRELGIAHDALVIGHVGRLDPVKNHELLLQSFALFSASHDNARLVCVGAGKPERLNALRAFADSCGIGDRVQFTGARRDLSAVYSAFDVLALTSRREGFPNVVAEAMACGVPAAVTNVGAAPEIVAMLGEVAFTDDAADYAIALSRLVARRSDELSAACRTRVLENFTLAHCARQTLAMLQSLNPRRTH
jgi:glycosyltransferase involved in cell wall biosynthesis